jgi:signal transduction histidine kinase
MKSFLLSVVLPIIICCAQVNTSVGQEKGLFVYSDDDILQPLRSGLLILEDPLSEYSPQQVVKQHGFIVNESTVPNLGISRSAFWIKFQIKNFTESEHLLVKLSQPNIEDIAFYDLKNSSSEESKSGLNYPYNQRKYDTHQYLFDIRLKKGETGTYLLRLKTTGQLQVPLSIGSYRTVYKSLIQEDLYMGLYIGLILAMFFYNLFIFSTIRSKSYLFYVLNIFMVGITQATFQGYTYRFLWASYPWIATHALVILTSVTGITSMSFVRVFLRVAKFNAKLDKGLQLFVYGFVPLIIMCVLGFESLSYQITQVASLLSAAYTFFVVFWVYRKGSRTAGFLLLAWSIFLFGICIFVLKDFGILPYNDFTNNIMLIGSGIEMLLLSFALADRINKLKKEKERSQKKMLETLRINEKLIQEDNLRLEAKVRERTRELEEAAEELNATVTNLKSTQAQLLQAEKMASLGQLTAGIAHEINNPINFVSASVKPLRRDINYLWLLMEKYETTLKSMEGDLHTMEVEAMKKRLDVEYLKEEIELLLKGVEDGATRTASIVMGLRNFSRLDDEELRPVNVHEGLDSTLLLLNHALKENVQVQKDYNLAPEIECYPGKLNQVFMNILTNAVQAIKAHDNPNHMGVLAIKTWQTDGYAFIEVRDNGIGMSEATQQKIFEPFFTTKEVGEGTGLGLSIAFGIIEAHRGKIEVKSTEGVGTEFLIQVPLMQVRQLASVA